MTIEEYYQSLTRNNENKNDFELFQFRPSLYIGFDKDNSLCVIVPSSSSNRNPIIRKTKILSIECNRCLSFSKEGMIEEKTVHIIRCCSTNEKDHILFLEIIDSIIKCEKTDEEVLDIFKTLYQFFSDRNEPSEKELIGLYGELEAIKSFRIEDYWQSKDRMKFDFSFNDVLKLEVKATTKNFRTHHFKHEQLMTDMYKIIILSYMFRYDDEGLSLFDLICSVKPLLLTHPQKLIRIDTIIKNTSEERLKGLKFSPEYTAEKRHFYLASSLPKFPEATPDGVANAEYDCELDNIPYLQDEDVLSMIKEVVDKDLFDSESGKV